MVSKAGNGLVLTKGLNSAEHLVTSYKMSIISVSFEKCYFKDSPQSVFWVRKQHLREDRDDREK